MKNSDYALKCSFLLAVLIILGQGDNTTRTLIGQFARTTDNSIVYLAPTGNWWFMDSFVDKAEFFVITEPLIRYDTLQFIRTQASEPIGVYPHIASDTARNIKSELSIGSALKIGPSGIQHIESISLNSVILTVPKCPREVLLTVSSVYVILMLLIDIDGNIVQSLILDTNWNSLWNETSYNSIQNIDFKPIIINGKTEKVWLFLPIGVHIERLPDITR